MPLTQHSSCASRSARSSPAPILYNRDCSDLPLALTPGTRIGSYEVTAQIGVGGMGEVYRATDSNLKRAVAIKVVPESVAGDANRLARFQREAEVLAALNNSHIAAIYGLERSGAISALVMELVEGPTLDERIAAGPLPVGEALRIAMQIADALEAAHEQGIVHRDLKPANIKVRPDGTVKVLDFGLAKAFDPAGAISTDPPPATTITACAVTTGVGTILGTAAYMSPEQARGKPVDRRADVWAFGCVLYEMLTGVRAFHGGDASSTLAKVLQSEPDFNALPTDLPPLVRSFLERCLEKDPRQRIHDINDVRLALDGAFDGALTRTGSTGGATAMVSTSRRFLVLAIAAVAGGVVSAAFIWTVFRPAPVRVSRTALPLSDSTAVSVDGSDRDVALTPDGTRIVYVGRNGTQLFVRALSQVEPVAIMAASGTVRGVFTSPDGDWVGFVEGTNTLRKVASTGGSPITLLTMDGNSLGAAWDSNDGVVFATANPSTGLQRVSVEGGTAEVLTRPDRTRGQSDHGWPEILPDGRGVLFTITAASGGLENAQIAVWDSSRRTSKILLRGGHHAHYVAGGYLVYGTGSTLRAIAFDPDRMEVSGTSVEVIPRLVTTGAGAADFAVATDGTLVYVDAMEGAAALTPVWVDRQGRETPTGAPSRSYQYPRLTPGGDGIALNISDDQQTAWVWDLRGGALRAQVGRLNPVWSSDGKRVVFAARTGGGDTNLYMQAADGSGRTERLTDGSNVQVATSMTPDGRSVVFHEINAAGDRDLRLLTLPGPGAAVRSSALIATRFDERNGIVSPDGRWLAYEADQSGQLEIYVRSFANPDAGEWRVSTQGGRQVVWTRNGDELFYVALDGSLMTVAVERRGSSWNAGAPKRLFDNRYFSGGGVPRQYDVAPDGLKVLVLKQGAGQAQAPQILVVLNWIEELKRLVPAQ